MLKLAKIRMEIKAINWWPHRWWKTIDNKKIKSIKRLVLRLKTEKILNWMLYLFMMTDI